MIDGKQNIRDKKIIDTVGVPKSTLVSQSVSDVCENLLSFY